MHTHTLYTLNKSLFPAAETKLRAEVIAVIREEFFF